MAKLTSREEQVYELMIAGMSDRAISEKLKIKWETARSHSRSVRSKLNMTRKEILARAAEEEGEPDIEDDDLVRCVLYLRRYHVPKIRYLRLHLNGSNKRSAGTE